MVGGGAVIGGAAGLAAVLRERDRALQRQAELTRVIQQASGMSTAFNSFAIYAGQAAQASRNMSNAWKFLGADLGNLITWLEGGQTTVDDTRNLFISAAQNSVPTIKQDITTIKGQLVGVKQVVNPDKEIYFIVEEEAKKAA